MPVRRYRVNDLTLELEEIPLNGEEQRQLLEQFVQSIGQHAERVGRSLEAFGIAIREMMLLRPEDFHFIIPAVSPERIRLESMMMAWQGVWQPGQENPDYSPGGVEQHREVHLVLLDLIKAGRREDYEYMARYEAHVPPDKIDELWERTRRMHRLDP
jgi:hypothetical protein